MTATAFHRHSALRGTCAFPRCSPRGGRLRAAPALALAVVLALGGCATPAPPVPAPAPQPLPANREPPPPNVNLSGFPLPYRQGYADGCASAHAAERKDAARFAGDGNYRMGWQDGLALCRKR